MSMLSEVINIYIYGSALVAVRFGWHLAYRLDRFDWHYGKVEIWFKFIVSVILWPLLLLWPRLLLKPFLILKDQYNQAERAREEEKLMHFPPPCGKLISYRPASGYGEESFGEFTFQAKDVIKILVPHLKAHPNLINGHDGAILNWLSKRDNSFDLPTPVPEAWSRFEYLADKLIRQGIGEVRCINCGDSIKSNECATSSSGIGWSWHHNILQCPLGHLLLEVPTIHIMNSFKKKQKKLFNA